MSVPVRMNLHNHTMWSDGGFSPNTIITKAIKMELDYIGISDHYQTQKVSSIAPDELEGYLTHIGQLKEEYSSQIHVLGGLEIDANPDRTQLQDLPVDLLNCFDYLLFEYIQDSKWEGIALWQLLNLTEDINVPFGLAHNDLGKNFAHIAPKELLKVLEGRNIFLELSSTLRNSKFNKPYYHYAEPIFTQVNQTKVLVSVGTDTHGNIDDVGDIQDAYDFIKNNGLENNLVTKLFD